VERVLMADCGITDLKCQLASGVEGVAGGAVEAVAAAVGDAVGEILKSVGTAWVKVPMSRAEPG